MLSWLCVHCNRGRLRSVVRHCLVSHQCRCVLQRLVWLTLCILAYRLFATTCKHPCLKPLGTHAKASLPLYERSVGFASCKAFGRSFQASLPCLLLPLHQTSPPLQPLQKDNNLSPRTKLASLVKGRWIGGKAQTFALLRFTCDMPTLFMLQTLLPPRRRDCLPLHRTYISPRPL